MGCEYHLDSALVKPTQERCLKLSGFYPTPQVKTGSDCKMFDVSNWVASLNGENGPRGTTSQPFQFHFRSTRNFPQPLDSLLPWTEAISAHLDWWQNPANLIKGLDLHPTTTVSNSLQTPQIKAGSLT